MEEWAVGDVEAGALTPCRPHFMLLNDPGRASKRFHLLHIYLPLFKQLVNQRMSV
jgi:hypothetical protein